MAVVKMDLNHQPPGPELENQKSISGAPGVAYGIAGHLFPLLNWTEVGRKFVPPAPKGAFMRLFWYPVSPAVQIFTSSPPKFLAGAGLLLLFSKFLTLEILPLTLLPPSALLGAQEVRYHTN